MNGRDFAGSYELTNLTDLGDTVSVTFTARVFNYSDADVSGAAAILDNTIFPGQPYWTFTGVSVANRDSVLLTCSVVVPHAEFDNWQQGARPYLHIDTPNGDGTFLSRTVELAQDVVEGSN